jgi:hypothetical protein
MFEYAEVLIKEHLSEHTSLQFLSVLHAKHIDEDNEDDEQEVFKSESALNSHIKANYKRWKHQKLIPFTNAVLDIAGEFKHISTFIVEFVSAASKTADKLSEALKQNNGNNNNKMNKIDHLNICTFHRDTQIHKMLYSLKISLSTHIFSSVANHSMSANKQCHQNHAKSAISYLFWVTLRLHEKKWLQERKSNRLNSSVMSDEDDEVEEEGEGEEEEEDEEEMDEEEEVELMERMGECWKGMDLLGWLNQGEITEHLSTLLFNEINEEVPSSSVLDL